MVDPGQTAPSAVRSWSVGRNPRSQTAPSSDVPIDEIDNTAADAAKRRNKQFARADRLLERLSAKRARSTVASEGEQKLDLEHLSPIRIVMIDNIHHGACLEQSDLVRSLNESAIHKLKTICQRGKEAVLCRNDVEPLELHWQISALSFFNVTNRAMFSRIFGDRLYRPNGQEMLRRHAVELILRFALRDR